MIILFCQWNCYFWKYLLQSQIKIPNWYDGTHVYFQFHLLNWIFFQLKNDLFSNSNLKACVRHFLSNFYFYTNWWPFKNYEMCFLFHLKSSFRSWDTQIFVILSLPFHTFQIQKDKWKWNNLWCHELACINLQMQFLE